MSFKNKVIIVTGAGSGIGAAISLHLAKQGANIVAVGRNELKLNDIAKRCSEYNQSLPLKADLRIDEDVKRIIQDTIKAFGKIDVLINNAGILGDRKKILDKDLVAVHDAVFNTNLRPVFLLTNLAAPYLAKTRGNIVNISSIGGLRGTSGYSAYAASKAALTHFGEVSAMELGEIGVRVNTVSPGPVETGFFGDRKDINIEVLKEWTVLKRVCQKEDVAEVVGFVAGDKVITGSNFVIDCGCLVNV